MFSLSGTIISCIEMIILNFWNMLTWKTLTCVIYSNGVEPSGIQKWLKNPLCGSNRSERGDRISDQMWIFRLRIINSIISANTPRSHLLPCHLTHRREAGTGFNPEIWEAKKWFLRCLLELFNPRERVVSWTDGIDKILSFIYGFLIAHKVVCLKRATVTTIDTTIPPPNRVSGYMAGASQMIKVKIVAGIWCCCFCSSLDYNTRNHLFFILQKRNCSTIIKWFIGPTCSHAFSRNVEWYFYVCVCGA